VPCQCWVWCKGMRGTDCHQYKSTLNMHEKAEPIGNSQCVHVLDVQCNAQSHHHGGVTMLCYLLQSCMYKIMYSTHLTHHFLKQRCTKMLHHSVYIRIQFVGKPINIRESKISFYCLNEHELLYGLCMKNNSSVLH
jgi:hypothetical protein